MILRAQCLFSSRRPPLPMPVPRPGCHLCSRPTSCKSEAPTTPSGGRLICQSISQDSGKAVYQFMLKVQMAEAHRARCVEGAELPCPLLGLSTPMFATPEALCSLCIWDFMEASSHSHERSLTPFPALLPSQENGGWAEISKLLIMAGSFRRPGAIQSQLIRTKDTPVTREITRVWGAGVRKGAETDIYFP